MTEMLTAIILPNIVIEILLCDFKNMDSINIPWLLIDKKTTIIVKPLLSCKGRTKSYLIMFLYVFIYYY